MPKKNQKELTCAEAAEMYNTTLKPLKAQSIRTICERDQKKPKNKRRYPGAYKRTERLWMIPLDDVLKDIAN